MDRSEIGLQLFKLFCEPFLNIGITLATLKLVGTTPVEKEILKIIVRGLDITCLIILRMLTGKL